MHGYVTAEITYSTAHEPLVALHMSIMRYWLGHGLVSGLPLYELCHESTGCCCTGATLECILVMQSEFILRLRYSYLMVMLCPLLWLLRRDAVLWLPCQPGENTCVCSSYCSLSLHPASDFLHCLPWVQQTLWTARQLASQIGSTTPRNTLFLPYMNFSLWITEIYSGLTILIWWLRR